jgi:aspartate/methionine/tyrosine aminotransferase
MCAALVADGWQVDHSDAGLYLWATRDEDCWESVRRLAARGILVAPGSFYGVAGARHVRVALTASDDAIGVAVDRLSGLDR